MSKKSLPNQQRTLNEPPSELRCKNLVTKHRLSIQIGAKREKNAMCVHILTVRIPPLVVGYLFSPIDVMRKDNRIYIFLTVLIPVPP